MDLGSGETEHNRESGLGAMAGSDIPATAPGATEPTTWELDSRLSESIPHLAYGLMTAVAYDAFDSL